MACTRGFLYWGRLDKRRPVLVISSDRFNLRSDYATVVPGSTRIRPLITHVKLAEDEGGIDRPTMLLCEHVQELRQSDLDAKPMGTALSDRRMREVEAAVMFYLGIDPARPGRAAH
jgi:mRNA-degrading endonuclease toxin of MazEF toxin-antitoxin module